MSDTEVYLIREKVYLIREKVHLIGEKVLEEQSERKFDRTTHLNITSERDLSLESYHPFLYL